MISGSIQLKRNKIYIVSRVRDESTGRMKPKWFGTGLAADQEEIAKQLLKHLQSMDDLQVLTSSVVNETLQKIVLGSHTPDLDAEQCSSAEPPLEKGSENCTSQFEGQAPPEDPPAGPSAETHLAENTPYPNGSAVHVPTNYPPPGQAYYMPVYPPYPSQIYPAYPGSTDVAGNVAFSVNAAASSPPVLSGYISGEEVKGTTPVSDCIRLWLTAARRKIDQITFNGYQYMASTYVIPYFENAGYTAMECTHQTIQRFIDETHLHGRKNGDDALSPKTMRSIFNVVSQTFTELIKAGVIRENPCAGVDLPKKVPREPQFYSIGQINTLLDYMRSTDDPLLPLIEITLIYGLRRSEVLGLKWDSIDFENDYLMIRHTVCRQLVTVEKDSTKTKASRRGFPLTPKAKEIFQKAKESEQDMKELFGSAYVQNDYVFKWPDGRTYSPDFLTKHFPKVAKACGLPVIRFHDLRHSCASVLLSEGFGIKDVQEWLGHSDIQTTANIYGHLDFSRKRSIADRLSCELSAATRNLRQGL